MLWSVVSAIEASHVASGEGAGRVRQWDRNCWSFLGPGVLVGRRPGAAASQSLLGFFPLNTRLLLLLPLLPLRRGRLLRTVLRAPLRTVLKEQIRALQRLLQKCPLCRMWRKSTCVVRCSVMTSFLFPGLSPCELWPKWSHRVRRSHSPGWHTTGVVVTPPTDYRVGAATLGSNGGQL